MLNGPPARVNSAGEAQKERLWQSPPTAPPLSDNRAGGGGFLGGLQKVLNSNHDFEARSRSGLDAWKPFPDGRCKMAVRR